MGRKAGGRETADEHGRIRMEAGDPNLTNFETPDRKME
jgi:hypothetical protein